ncbi:glycosyltransferase family 39 protein [Candidatus Shapirobacteria bacterium]|nr:glycosyltransferase family 39 protein [Candidatus Shapirobacteria bacterium]
MMVKHKVKFLHWVPLVLLIFLSFFLRFYKLEELTTFLDDQGRDVLKAAQIIKEKNLPFIGPMASIGNVYLGPLYYWAIAPFLWLFNFNPVGPVVLVALLGVLTNILLFFFLWRYFDKTSAFFASFLYALSPLILQNSRFSWNPNPVPFFTLLWFILMLKFFDEEKGRWLFGAGICLGILLQLHYVTGLLLIFTVIGFLFWLVKKSRRESFSASFLKPFGWLILGVIIPLIPFILFEFKNYFLNTRAAWEFLFGGQKEGALLVNPLERALALLNRFLQELLGLSRPSPIPIIYFASTIFSLFLAGRKKLGEERNKVVFPAILILISTPLLLCLAVKDEIHLHYIGILYPFIFIIVAAGDYLWRKIKLWPLVILNSALFLWAGYQMATWDYQRIIKADSNHQIEKAKLTAEYIEKEAEDKNIFVASLTGSPSAYQFRYFLYVHGFATDSLHPSSIFAVCCDNPCQPEKSIIWEFAQFGALKTVSEKMLPYGVWVYELKIED